MSWTRTPRRAASRPPQRTLAWGLGACLTALLVCNVALAHPLAPAALILHEAEGQPAGTLEVTWRTSRVRPRGEALRPILPARCTTVSDSEHEELRENVLAVTSLVRCGAGEQGDLLGLAGQELRIEGLDRTETNVFVELRLRDGRQQSALLHARRPTMRFEEQQATARPADTGFVRLGVGHLLSGADHVLFVLGLVLLVSGLRQLFWLVSAFTVGHSVSLALSATGVVQLPSAPIEIIIALSLLWLALRVLHRREHLAEPAPPVRRAALVCAAFGLLHGLGFASAFAETGASGDTLPLALLGFNVGVELGQLAIVVPATLLLGLLRKRDTEHRWQPRVMLAGAYVIGVASAYFTLDRVPGVVAELMVALG